MRKRTVIILKGFAVIVVALGVIYAIAVAVSSAKLHRVYATLEKDGRPMKPTSVIPPKVPDSENAALLYESAGLLLKAQPAPTGNLLEYAGGLAKTLMKESLPPDKLVELQQIIEQDVVTQALGIVEQATRRHSCRFDRDYDSGINILLPDLSILRDLSYIVGAKARFKARAGRLDEAWKTAQTQFKMAEATLNEPILVGQLVRIALIRFSLKTMMALCETAPLSNPQYRHLQELLIDLDVIDPLVRAIDGERLLFGEWAFNLPKDELHKLSAEHQDPEDMSGIIHRLIIFRISFRPFFLADRAAYMRLMHESVEFMKRPYPREAFDMEKELEETHHLMTKMLTPAIPRVKVIYCEMTAELRIMQAGLALLQYKQSRNTFPDTLESLKLNNIIDPFSEVPLRYKPQGEGFILYSIGPDLKDNDGSPKQEGQTKDWDIVWQFPKDRSS